MTDALLLVDVIKDFRHEDGERLLASYRERFDALKATLARAREDEVRVIFVNDNAGLWDGDVRRLVRQAIEEGLAGDLVEQVTPREGDRFVVKPRYSAFRRDAPDAHPARARGGANPPRGHGDRDVRATDGDRRPASRVRRDRGGGSMRDRRSGARAARSRLSHEGPGIGLA
jgi:hypothetical protein